MLQSHRVDTVDCAQLRLQVRFRPMLTGALGSFRSGNSQKLVEDDGATDQYRTAANIDKNAAKYLRLQRLGFGNRTVPFEIRRNTYLLILLVKLEAASLQSMNEMGHADFAIQIRSSVRKQTKPSRLSGPGRGSEQLSKRSRRFRWATLAHRTGGQLAALRPKFSITFS